MADAVRATYRSSKTPYVMLLGAGMTVFFPVLAWKLGAEGQSLAWALPFVAVPMTWFFLATLVTRIDLTDSHLVLRSLARQVRVPLADVAEVGGFGGQNVVKVVRRDGHSWKVLSGAGSAEFFELVAQTQPHVQARSPEWYR